MDIARPSCYETVRNDDDKKSSDADIYNTSVKLEDPSAPSHDEQWTYNFFITPLNLNISPTDFKIPNDKSVKYTVKCEAKIKQDLIVQVHSLFFEIVGARCKRGVTSQEFHILSENETMTFEVGMKDLNNVSYENYQAANLLSPAGFITFTHFKSLRKDDASWGVKDPKKLMKVVTKGDGGRYNLEKLLVETETDSIKKISEDFAMILQQGMDDKRTKEQEMKMGNMEMFATEEYVEKWKKDKKAIEIAQKNQREWNDKKLEKPGMQKKKEKKCNIM